jgi:hypothetical protein
MTDYKECGSEVIKGRKRTLFSKPNSTKKYVTHKGRKMNVVNYKKMLEKREKDKVLTSKKVQKKKRTSKKRGGAEEEGIQELHLGKF